MKTLIFDSNAARLQWTSNRESYLEALKEFYAALGIDPHNRGLNPRNRHTRSTMMRVLWWVLLLNALFWIVLLVLVIRATLGAL